MNKLLRVVGAAAVVGAGYLLYKKLTGDSSAGPSYISDAVEVEETPIADEDRLKYSVNPEDFSKKQDTKPASKLAFDPEEFAKPDKSYSPEEHAARMSKLFNVV